MEYASPTPISTWWTSSTGIAAFPERLRDISARSLRLARERRSRWVCCAASHDEREWESRRAALAASAFRLEFRHSSSMGGLEERRFPVAPRRRRKDRGHRRGRLRLLRRQARAGQDAWRTKARNAPSSSTSSSSPERSGLPLLLHLRKAMDLAFFYAPRLGGLTAPIFHSFSGTERDAESLLAKGVNAVLLLRSGAAERQQARRGGLRRSPGGSPPRRNRRALATSTERRRVLPGRGPGAGHRGHGRAYAASRPHARPRSRRQFQARLRRLGAGEALGVPAPPRACASTSRVPSSLAMAFFRPFALERYFAQYEFELRRLLSSSDCETMSTQARSTSSRVPWTLTST